MVQGRGLSPWIPSCIGEGMNRKHHYNGFSMIIKTMFLFIGPMIAVDKCKFVV